MQAVQTSTGLDIPSLSDFTQERLRLPIRMKGLGMRSLVDRRHAEYVGGMIQGIPPLMDTKNDNGVQLTGKLATTSMKRWIGADSFKGDTECTNWTTTINNGGPIGQALVESWTHMTEEMKTTIAEQDLLGSNITYLHSPLHRAGFTVDGKRYPGSITKQITTEIEGLRFETISKKVLTNDATFNLNPRERLAFSQVDTLSSQFLTALPDVLGIINDDAILECFHQHLGLHSPAMKPYVDTPHYIGRKGREMEVDVYGDVVARAMMPGGDFIKSHEELKRMMAAIFRQSGFAVSVEPPNIFHGKIPVTYLNKYLDNHALRDSIIPDILVHDYKGDSNSHGSGSMEAIFDVKTLRVDKSSNFYKQLPNGLARRATDTKVNTVRRDYMRRAEKLDLECTDDDSTKPFANALKNKFNSGGVHPLVFGAFGEANTECEKLIRMCAKMHQLGLKMLMLHHLTILSKKGVVTK